MAILFIFRFGPPAAAPHPPPLPILRLPILLPSISSPHPLAPPPPPLAGGRRAAGSIMSFCAMRFPDASSFQHRAASSSFFFGRLLKSEHEYSKFGTEPLKLRGDGGRRDGDENERQQSGGRGGG
eukprot:5786724-Pyramimonas_sp.AAC.1